MGRAVTGDHAPFQEPSGIARPRPAAVGSSVWGFRCVPTRHDMCVVLGRSVVGGGSEGLLGRPPVMCGLVCFHAGPRMLLVSLPVGRSQACGARAGCDL